MTVLALPRRAPRRVAMLSVHTSPLDRPGAGDAGGLNVYVVELARRLAAAGTAVDVLTRAARPALPPTVPLADGVRVRHLVAGPRRPVPKEDLPRLLPDLTAAALDADDASYDLVHSHYWLSGEVGRAVAAAWDVPLVHTPHTLARVKHLGLADGEAPEPAARVAGEHAVVAAADRLVANTVAEADHLVRLYGADPERVATVAPGVDLDTFAPGDRRVARAALGLPADRTVLLFVGRVQPLKAPDVLLRALSLLVRRDPALRRRLLVAVVGGSSGGDGSYGASLRRLAADLGVADLVRFRRPVDRAALAAWYRAADVTVVPSRSESFGLVALESQACGTPVVAAAVGGLRTAVADGRSGLLVGGHDPGGWASALGTVVADAALRRELGRGARRHAEGFGWPATAAAVLDAYAAAARGSSAPARRVAGGRG